MSKIDTIINSLKKKYVDTKSVNDSIKISKAIRFLKIGAEIQKTNKEK